MQSFSQFNESTSTDDADIIGIIKSFNGSSPIDIKDDYITTTVPTMEQLNQIIESLPDDLDYEVLVESLTSDFSDEDLTVSPDSDSDDTEYDIENINESDEGNVFQLIIYTYNTSQSMELDEVKRRIKINAKGKRRIKMQCKKGFKFDGKKCVKISGAELVNKRKAIRKAVRTKKSKGSGFQKRVARLRNRAMKKRRNMGVRNFK